MLLFKTTLSEMPVSVCYQGAYREKYQNSGMH